MPNPIGMSAIKISGNNVNNPKRAKRVGGNAAGSGASSTVSTSSDVSA